MSWEGSSLTARRTGRPLRRRSTTTVLPGGQATLLPSTAGAAVAASAAADAAAGHVDMQRVPVAALLLDDK